MLRLALGHDSRCYGIELDEEGFDDYCDSMMEGNGFNSREDLYAAYGPTEDAGKAISRKFTSAAGPVSSAPEALW